MRAKDNLCPVTGAQCYAPDCTDSRCDFQDPSEARDEGFTMKAGIRDSSFIDDPKQTDPDKMLPPEPALETRVENLEKGITDLYGQIMLLKQKWEGK